MTVTLPRTDIITKAVALASRAPSLHNSQPWRWRFDRDGLKLYADPERLISATDSAGRELILSCGGALHHLRAAMASMGYRSFVERFPNPNDPRFLARVEFVRSGYVTDAERDRIEAIKLRRSDRSPFAPPAGWSTFETVLRHTLGNSVLMTVMPANVRADLERASSLAGSMRRYDSKYHSELHWWTGHVHDREGVPPQMLPSAETSAKVPIGRAFPVLDDAQPADPESGADGAVIVALSTDTDNLPDILRCGEAMSVVLLEATMAGYATCTVTHVVELSSSRFIVQKLVGGNVLPQVLIRIGAPPAGGLQPSLTPRRSVEEILEIAS
ncbi:Acg family FMN-binding oxidoreductase [Smaragdicoccus niigatensis]|uniref:Acg family FMN-binding oxidoreductase n=1 Tax=Smaragdicoccus niigatensis TaxID=359359 RepID=UPI00036F0A6F|nr:hypothetical protein [Smaragdicoccus niigatensis]